MEEARKPEYETVTAFGSMLLNEDLELIIKANDICDRTGLDTMSAGAAIAFATECYERGIITKQDTDGIELGWGKGESIIALLKKMARQEGLGVLLADGVKRAADKLGHGSADYAIHVHGQEIAYHDPGLIRSRGMAYIADPTPGRHMVSHAMNLVGGGVPLSPYPELVVPEEESAKYVVAGSYGYTFVATGLCFMAYTPIFPLVEFIRAVTGWDFTPEEVILTGRRIQTLRQAFNAREGISPKEMSLPKRLTEPRTTEALIWRKADFAALRDSYYEAMGWDARKGIPRSDTMKKLGLQEFI